MPDRYYKKELYPFQDEVLGVIGEAGSDFYLTGGTALSRAYLQHRYSEDLDFFVNDAVDFKKQTQTIITALQSHFGVQPQIGLAETSYVRLFLRRESVVLKIEFVNDVPFHVGEFKKTKLFNRIDSWQNILANKISALGRDEAKDFADILFLAGRFTFQWQEMIAAAKKKDLWANELAISELFFNFAAVRMADLHWIRPFAPKPAERGLKTIAADILRGRENSLAKESRRKKV
jgi:hypothetical protein